MLDFKKWQRAIGDCFSAILSQFNKTFRTHYYTIISFFTSLLDGYSWYRVPKVAIVTEGGNILTTLSTNNAIPINPILPTLSLFFNERVKSKIHEKPPISKYWWEKGCIGEYWYYSGDEHTGIIINTVSDIWFYHEHRKMNHLMYAINFHIHAFSDNYKFHHIIEVPTFKEAKELAEWYYNVWSKSKMGDIYVMSRDNYL